MNFQNQEEMPGSGRKFLETPGKKSPIKYIWSKVHGGSKTPEPGQPDISANAHTQISSGPVDGNQTNGQPLNAKGIPVYSTRRGYRFTGEALTEEQWKFFFSQEKELENARDYIVKTGTAYQAWIDFEAVRQTLEERVAAQAEVFAKWRRDNFGEGEFVPVEPVPA